MTTWPARARIHATTVMWGALVAAATVVACDKRRSDHAPAPASASSPSGPTVASVASAVPSGAAATMPVFDPVQLRPFAPVPEGVERPVVDDTVKLGHRLYFDTRLSRGNDVSCATCHDFSRAGADGEVLSTGTMKRKSTRNTPTVLNAGGAFAQGWDARASTIEDFVLPHVLAEPIMGMGDAKRVTDTLASIPAYAAAFKKAFADESAPISGETFGRALGGYVKKLFARSRWDKYLGGDTSALTEAELGGLAMFVEAGCTSCHQGKYVGATQSQKLGIAKPWPPPGGSDPGRFEVTKQEADRGLFKVPTLRNVTRTAPYLHDGSVATLEEATRWMARHQVGRELSEPQVTAIVQFLRTLEGDPPKELTQKPDIPKGR